jgi:hypothetical protein
MYATTCQTRFPFIPSLITLAVSIAITSQTALAENFSARSMAMGGTAVASSQYDAAASNPALLTRFDKRDDMAVTLPAVSVEAFDQHHVLTTLQDVKHLYDGIMTDIDSGNIAGALALKDKAISKIQSVSDKPINVTGDLLLGVAIPSKTLAISVEARSRAEGYTLGHYDPGDDAIVTDAINSLDSSRLNNIKSYGQIAGAAVSETAVSLAHEFTVGSQDMPLAVGITPKFQYVQTAYYNALAKDFRRQAVLNGKYTTDNTHANMDMGFALSPTHNVTIGLQLRDLVQNDNLTVVSRVDGSTLDYRVKPQATTGIAYRGNMFTAACDVDLNQHQPFPQMGGTQFVRAGAEFSLHNWLQLRAGARHDLQGTQEDVLTGGIGLTAFKTLHIDVSLLAGKNHDYGGALDLRTTF